ncbi:MAG: prepilin-type N-terminal cleavage/methylation domain-containing protein [Desulfobacteraceae bacterium]
MSTMVKGNEKGFTLIEIMIVIAIIGILASIAIPQFMTYRMRSYNSAAKAIVHNLRSDNANLNSELGVYGHTEAIAAIRSAADAGAGAADTRAVQALSAPATTTLAGARLSGRTTETVPRAMAIPIALGHHMVANCLDINDASNQTSYTIFTRHIKGDTAYAVDGDIENSIYSVSNPAWPNLAGLQATPVNPTLAFADEIRNAAGGGSPTAAWTLIP